MKKFLLVVFLLGVGAGAAFYFYPDRVTSFAGWFKGSESAVESGTPTAPDRSKRNRVEISPGSTMWSKKSCTFKIHGQRFASPILGSVVG